MTNSQSETVAITPELIESQGLLPEEYEKIVKLLGREPNFTELGVFGAMWSEHCSYKNSKLLLKQFPVERANPRAANPILVKAGEENAGVVDIGDGWAICFKIESHNHPSAVEPFEGAATGVGGILRDIFTMGARPILLTNSLRFGELDSAVTRRLLRGVVAGIGHYGNCIGVPNLGGDVYFDNCYEGNPLVNALCLGIMRHDQIKRGAASGVGNPVFYVGSPTGRDGLGGASFASRELTEESAADRPAVQKGDPFMEKLLVESCLEMMAVEGLVVGVQDMGAAGLTCSTCETAARGNTGIEIELDRVPQRETGMNAYEILLSESQERMLVIAQRGRETELEAIFEKWDLHAVEIGKVVDGNEMIVLQNGVPVVQIPAKILADEGPLYARKAECPAYLKTTCAWDPTTLPDLDWTEVKAVLPRLLAEPTIANKHWIWQQYDHGVMGNTVLEPGSDAGVVRLRLDQGREKFLAIANDCNHRYCYLDPYRGAQSAILECLRNLTCSGARPLAMTNNLNFGNPYKPEAFYMLRESVRGLADACRFFDLPVLGGNVSLYNEHHRGAIDPTPVVAIAGLIDEREMITSQYVEREGAVLILIGGWPCELGGSYYMKVLHDLKTGAAPAVDLEGERRQNLFLLSQIRARRVEAAHDLSEGGLLVAIAEMLFGRGEQLGISLKLSVPRERRLDALLYGESQGRILIAVAADKAKVVLEEARVQGLQVDVLGHYTRGSQLSIEIEGEEMTPISWDVLNLRECWGNSLAKRMKVD